MSEISPESYLRKRLEREKSAREQAELLLETKSSELFEVNQRLERVNENLDELVKQRTKALQEQSHRAEQTSHHLKTTLDRLDLVLTATNAISWTFYIQSQQMELTHGNEAITALTANQLIPLETFLEYIHFEDQEALRHALLSDAYLRSRFDLRVRMRNGRQGHQWFSVNGCLSRSEQDEPILVGSLIDVHTQVQNEQEAWRLANIDALTQVANRYQFERLFEIAKKEAHQRYGNFTLALFDINEFKLINDSFGTRIADATLRTLGSQLQTFFNEMGSVARLAADEFVVLFDQGVTANEAFKKCEQLLQSMDHITVESGDTVAVSLSSGLACYPTDGTNIDALIQAIQTANHHSKQSRYGKPECVMFHPGMSFHRQRARDIRQNLQLALKRAEFSLALQPIVAPNGVWIGAEALLRWPKGPRDCSTQEFISVAESCGLILPIGEWVIEHAAELLLEIHTLVPDFWLSINVSAIQFQHHDIAAKLSSVKEHTGADLSKLTIEVTESLFLDNLDRVKRNLNAIKKLGCTIAIDDFGSGYSSLNYVQRLPIDYIKIDKAFIDNVADSVESQNIARAIVSMSHSMDRQVVAEGVEHQSQADTLRELGCDALQGYLFAQPLMSDAFMKQLVLHRSESALAV